MRNVTWYSIEHSYSGDKDVQISSTLWASTEIDVTKDYAETVLAQISI